MKAKKQLCGVVVGCVGAIVTFPGLVEGIPKILQGVEELGELFVVLIFIFFICLVGMNWSRFLAARKGNKSE